MGRKILFITTDQMRYDAIGANGGNVARTPNIDSFAANGTSSSDFDVITEFPTTVLSHKMSCACHHAPPWSRDKTLVRMASG